MSLTLTQGIAGYAAIVSTTVGGYQIRRDRPRFRVTRGPYLDSNPEGKSGGRFEPVAAEALGVLEYHRGRRI